jgi:gluconate kinase
MLFIFMGPSCSGKSSAAKVLKEKIKASVYTGKDYLRFAKNKDEAYEVFMDELHKAAVSPVESSIVYVITEKQTLQKLRHIQGTCLVKFSAELGVLKNRFVQRTGGNLPSPVASMLERQYHDWESETADIHIDTSVGQSPDSFISKLMEHITNTEL